MQTVGRWLEQLGLAQYTEAFERNAVDLELVRELTDPDLEKLGVLALGHRKRLLKAISELNGVAISAGTPQPVPDQPSPARYSSVEAERRQLTVMFCDLVGSTELATKLDPEQLRDLMHAYQRACGEVIAAYEGHVAQYLGDGLMVYFGWPVAHEDDAARAIRAALEVTQAVSQLKAAAPIRARVGIHTGVVVVGETGQGDASIPKAAVGDTPNIAARLQGVAEPGTVAISQRTRALAGGLFDYADLGIPTLKGVSEPLRVFGVLGSRAIESRFEATRSESGLTPLVGREQEIALLLRRWQEAKEGEGQVLLVGGEPGIGKSRLTRVLRERLGEQSYTPLRYQCSPYHVNSALYPVIEQFERAAGFTREDTPERRLDKLEAVLAGTKAQVAESAPLFAAMLSLPTKRYPALNLFPEKQKENTLEALAAQVETLAKRQPLVMIWEDVHWIDPTSQESLDVLVPRLQGLPVLLFMTYRPEYSPKWAEQAHVTILGLSRLDRRQGAELVTKLTGGKALPAEVLEQILAHTDGVPLFVEELTKSILESELLRDAGDRYVLDGPLPPLAIPTTLRDSLIARLDRLAPIRAVAQIGACIGREFAYEMLAAVSPLKGTKLDDALGQLTSSGLLFRRGAPPDATYTFKHALVQDAAYDSLLKSRRAQLHAQIAQVLEQNFPEILANEPEVLAHHFTGAGLNERAVPYWMKAGQRALERVALAEAVGHLNAALKVNQQVSVSADRDRQQLEIRVLLGVAYQAFRGWAASEIVQALEPALELAIRLGEDTKLSPVLSLLWGHYEVRSNYPAALKLIDQLDSLAASRPDTNLLLVARYAETHTLIAMGHFRRSDQTKQQVLRAYDDAKNPVLGPAGNMDLKCDVLVWAGYCLFALGYADQARYAVEEGLELARCLGNPFNLCWSLCGGSTWTLLQRGDTDLALQWVSDARAVALEHGMGFVIDVLIPGSRGYALIEQGHHEEGCVEVIRGIEGFRDRGGRHTLPYSNMMRARALMELGRFQEARILLQEAIELTDATGQRAFEAEVHRILGELNRRERPRDIHAAETSFRKALDVAHIQEAKGFELRAAMSLARVWQSQGRRTEARDLLAPLYNWFTEGFHTRDLKQAGALLDELR